MLNLSTQGGMPAGAYGFAMNSSYNSRPRVAGVMVQGDLFEVVRERETIEESVKGERSPRP
jgi:diaminopimelate decarboxylase